MVCKHRDDVSYKKRGEGTKNITENFLVIKNCKGEFETTEKNYFPVSVVCFVKRNMPPLLLGFFFSSKNVP